jgi:lipid-A-disaccharide synthase
MSNPSIMFVAGDPSGDEHAAPIIRRLTARYPDAEFVGVGGPAMQAQGFSALMPFEQFNRMGLWEVLVHLPFFLNAKRRLVAAMDRYKPKALVCVDYPGLNMPLMREAHRRAIPVIWYIVPQVWAWKQKRAAVLGTQASFIGVVFPFEAAFFASYKAPVSFVGHPLVEAMEQGSTGPASAGCFSDPSRSFRLALIPGSRPQEVASILPSMAQAAFLIQKKHPRVAVTVSKCKGLPQELFQKYSGGGRIELFEGPLRALLSRTDAALVTSGTATLETALAKVPMVIVYRTSPVTYGVMKRLIRIPFIGLPNIVAGEKIVPECIQNDANPQRLAEEMDKFIVSREHYDRTVEKLSRLRALLGDRKPSEEMAEAIAAVVEKHSDNK